MMGRREIRSESRIKFGVWGLVLLASHSVDFLVGACVCRHIQPSFVGCSEYPLHLTPSTFTVFFDHGRTHSLQMLNLKACIIETLKPMACITEMDTVMKHA